MSSSIPNYQILPRASQPESAASVSLAARSTQPESAASVSLAARSTQAPNPFTALRSSQPDLPEREEETAGRLYGFMRQLTSKMSIFSSFEMAMAALGTVLSRGSSYWTSYLGASVVEWVENKATSDEDKLMPKPITQLFAWLCQLWQVKDNQGEALTWEKALSQGLREKVIGTFNASLSIVTAAHALFRPLINFLSQNDEEERPGPFTHFCKTVLPVFNTMLMWASSSAKLRLAHAVSGLKKPTDLVEPMDLCGHANSGREDAVCGMESAGLMLGHLISSFNAPLGKLYDTALGLWVAFNSFRNGQTGMKGTAEEGPNTEDLRARYPLGFLQQGAVGDFFYKIVHRLCSWMKLELPNPSEISGLLTKDVA